MNQSRIKRSEKILMQKLLVCIFFFMLCSLQATAQPILERIDSLQLTQANIWGGISFNGENISVTTTLNQGRSHLFLRKLDSSLHQISNVVQVTFDSDSVTSKHITDHKHLFLNGFHFISFSVAGDSDLYIMKVDRDGKRVSSIVPVIEHTSNRTNDMMFCTDGEKLYIAYFKPTSQSIVHIIDQNLNQVSQPIITSAKLPHNNLGGMIYRDSKFYMFTGDKAGPNSNLILTIWNKDWTPAISQPLILIQPQSGEGLFFPTGIAFDSLWKRWYIGFHHAKNSNPDATTHIDLAVFDENFLLLEYQHHQSAFRPHFLLLGEYLYSVYDKGGVFIDRYHVQQQAWQGKAINWKPFFTLNSDEGIDWIVDTTQIALGGVPVINLTNDERIILNYSGNAGAFEVRDNGVNLSPISVSKNRAADGGVIYLPDGRMRFLGEQMSPNGGQGANRRSYIASSISNDGINWMREQGIRFQPGISDDSISSVPSFIQIKDSIWRMYYVGDFKGANGTRTAITTDWGWTWKSETMKNILTFTGDVDPHPMYLSNGKYRLYFRTGFTQQDPAKRGLAYCDSDDGVTFDTTKINLIIADSALPKSNKLDPWVIKYPNGNIVCYFGAAPPPNIPNGGPGKLICAWAKKKPTHVSALPDHHQISMNAYPNPFKQSTTINIDLTPTLSYEERETERRVRVSFKIYDIFGREVLDLSNQIIINSILAIYNYQLPSNGIYFYRLTIGNEAQTKMMVLLR